jgi:hypothetical protein
MTKPLLNRRHADEELARYPAARVDSRIRADGETRGGRTLVTLGVSVGVIANPAGAAATLSGLPAAVAAFLALPNL